MNPAPNHHEPRSGPTALVVAVPRPSWRWRQPGIALAAHRRDQRTTGDGKAAAAAPDGDRRNSVSFSTA